MAWADEWAAQQGAGQQLIGTESEAKFRPDVTGLVCKGGGSSHPRETFIRLIRLWERPNSRGCSCGLSVGPIVVSVSSVAAEGPL